MRCEHLRETLGSGERRGHLSLDSQIGALLDDAKAMPRVIAAIRHHGTALADQILAQEDLPMHQAVTFMPKRDQILASIADALFIPT